MRRPGIAAPSLLIIALLLMGMAGVAPAAARQDASPAAGTPPVAPPPTQAAAQPAPAATPAPPAAPATTDVVTLVVWYNNPLDQDIIELFPIVVDANFAAGPAPGAGSVGTVDFPADGSPPTIVLGDTTFETYPRPDGVIERWTWLDDFEGARPGTLVMQLAGLEGTYQNYFGAATFVSRDEGGVGGVITIALRPPSPAAPAAATAPAAEAAPAEEAAVAETTGDAVAEEAIQPEATVDPGTIVLDEPVVEGGIPAEGVEGEVVTEPTG